MRNKVILFPSIILVLAIISCQTFLSNNKIDVVMQPKSNSKASGNIFLSENSNGNLHIEGKIIGLEPDSIHGFHFHEKGDCSDKDAVNAGGHFNPDKEHVHGISITSEYYMHQHAGDLGNIKANDKGIAIIDLTVKDPHFSLDNDKKYSLIGKSIVVHANADDEKSQPAGDAGKRILCGVIK